MIEKIGPIKNPLTIIAIFAAIAEISGTVVLPFIAPANQATYVWFLIVFPILLIVLFFLTLNFNHEVLYAPSDYQNEDNFLRCLPKATLAERILKIDAEIFQDEETVAQILHECNKTLSESEEALSKASSVTAPAIEAPPISYQSPVHRTTQTSYMLAEELIFRKLSKEFSAEIQREVILDSPDGGRYLIDGIVHERGITTFIEVMFLRHALMSSIRLLETLARIQESAAKLLPSKQTANFRLLLALASDESNVSQQRVMAQIDRYRSEFTFPIEVRFYNLAELGVKS